MAPRATPPSSPVPRTPEAQRLDSDASITPSFTPRKRSTDKVQKIPEKVPFGAAYFYYGRFCA